MKTPQFSRVSYGAPPNGRLAASRRDLVIAMEKAVRGIFGALGRKQAGSRWIGSLMFIDVNLCLYLNVNIYI